MMTREEKAIALLEEILKEGQFFLCAVEATNIDTCDFMDWQERAREVVRTEPNDL